MSADVMEVLQVRDPDEPAGAKDSDPVADMLDLGEDMRRKELVELLLVQRIEPARRLVEDEEIGLVHEGEQDSELSLVAG